MIFLTRFRRALGPRVDRWIQDGVWQLQRRAYEGEGYRAWMDLEADIPLMDEKKLKDLSILWLPGKSPALRGLEFGLDPAVNYGESVHSSDSRATMQVRNHDKVRTLVEESTVKEKSRGIKSFWRSR